MRWQQSRLTFWRTRERGTCGPLFLPSHHRTDGLYTLRGYYYTMHARLRRRTLFLSLFLSFFLPSPQGYCIIANTIYRSCCTLLGVQSPHTYFMISSSSLGQRENIQKFSKPPPPFPFFLFKIVNNLPRGLFTFIR